MDKSTLPLDVSKGIQFDFTVEGITEEQADKLLGLILDELLNNYKGSFVAGGFVSVAHMEELEREQIGRWNGADVDLLDMVDDDISLDDLDLDEENRCAHGKLWYLCSKCDDNNVFGEYDDD